MSFVNSFGQPGINQGVYSAQPGANPGFPGQQFLSDPMANMAMQYGQNLADQGKDMMHKNVRHSLNSPRLNTVKSADIGQCYIRVL